MFITKPTLISFIQSDWVGCRATYCNSSENFAYYTDIVNKPTSHKIVWASAYTPRWAVNSVSITKGSQLAPGVRPYYASSQLLTNDVESDPCSIQFYFD